MAGLLFVYSRTSIRAAKLNAQRHREADGGQISWHNESLRRHGQMTRPEEGTVRELLLGGKDAKAAAEDKASNRGRSQEEKRLRARMGKGHDEGGGTT
ncbi:MAG: hypothetical protein M1820_000366 [Bogoriella megaspora]|nr:MAG: hypothetical protein M1820_000366 [Bogoriella megaspora]